jgi:hypothetical protein
MKTPMKKLVFICLPLLVCLASCRDKGNDVMKEVRFRGETLTEIYIDNISPEVVEMNLSDLFTGFRIIPLETSENCIIGGFNKIATLTERDIFIGFFREDPAAVVYRFDNDGNFLNSIGRGGRGPGEHIGFDVSNIVPDERNGLVTVDWSGYVADHPITYKYDGSYVNDVHYPEDLLSGFYRWSDDEWFSAGSVSGIPEYPRDSILIIFYNNEGKRTGLQPRSLYPSGSTGKYSPYGGINIHAYNDIYKVFSPESDTVYQITKEKLVPTEVIFCGKDGMPYYRYMDPQATIGKHYIEIVAETDAYYLIKKSILTKADLKEYRPGHWGGIVDHDINTIIIDKKSKKGAYVNITDDIFGFLPEWFQNNFFYQLQVNTISFQIDAMQFLNSLKETGTELEKLVPLTTSPVRLKTLTENDNPVLITFKLKDRIKIAPSP